jgi:hypothetical protein
MAAPLGSFTRSTTTVTGKAAARRVPNMFMVVDPTGRVSMLITRTTCPSTVRWDSSLTTLLQATISLNVGEAAQCPLPSHPLAELKKVLGTSVIASGEGALGGLMPEDALPGLKCRHAHAMYPSGSSGLGWSPAASRREASLLFRTSISRRSCSRTSAGRGLNCFFPLVAPDSQAAPYPTAAPATTPAG